MAVTVKDLLQLAFPEGTSVAAGRAGLDREVVWARTLRPRPPAFETIEGGELALLSTAQLSLFESLSLAYVVARLAEVGVAAVAVLGDVDPAATGAAESRGFPLLRLPDGVSLTDVERTVIASIVDHQALLQRRASDIHRQLAQLVFEERGLPAVAERLAEICGKAVVLEDDLFRLRFAVGSPDVPSPETLDLKAGRKALEDWVRTVTLSSAQPPVGRFAISDGIGRFASPVPSRDGVAGYLSVVAPAETLTELDRLAVGRGAAVCAMEVAKAAAVEEAEARLRGDLLEQLLSRGLDDDQIALGKARRLGFDPTLPAVVMAFRGAEERRGLGQSVRSTERARAQLESIVRLELSRRESKCLVAARGATVLAVVPIQGGGGDGTVRSLAGSLKDAAEAALTGCTVAVGVGRPTTAGASLAAAHREAEEALAIGARINGPSSVTCFADLGIVRLLTQVSRTAELEAFCEEFLGKLEAHDHKTGGELIKTLESLFQANGNLSRTAEQLSLHRNSLLYRMDRIREISGHDLEDPETRLSIQVALKVRQLLEADRARRG